MMTPEAHSAIATLNRAQRRPHSEIPLGLAYETPIVREETGQRQSASAGSGHAGDLRADPPADTTAITAVVNLTVSNRDYRPSRAGRERPFVPAIGDSIRLRRYAPPIWRFARESEQKSGEGPASPNEQTIFNVSFISCG
jgi:hypothetical protein